jgi:putative transposase
LSRSSYLYAPKARRDYELQLVDRIKKLSKDNPIDGYRFITDLLARDGWRENRKKVQRIPRAEGLRGHQTKKKSRRRGGSTTEPRSAAASNDVWSWDFIFDTTEDGQTIKVLSIVDEFSRFCIDLNVKRKISSSKVLEALDLACERSGAPKCIRSDTMAPSSWPLRFKAGRGRVKSIVSMSPQDLHKRMVMSKVSTAAFAMIVSIANGLLMN